MQNHWLKTYRMMEEFHVSPEIEHMAEIVKGKLYFAVTYSEKTELIKNTQDNFYFNIDEELVYLNYYMDFGPLNISCLYKYCLKLQSYMQCSQIKRIIHYTSCDPCRRVNAAYLMGSYGVIYLNMDPKFLYRKVIDAGGAFRQFVDASQGASRYTLKLLECLHGVQKAHALNFFDFNDFNVAEYDLYDKIQNGDFNWLVPRKFLALIGPIDKEISPNGHAPNFYIKYFLKNDVRTVIRLNNKLYDSFIFSKAGIEHYDLFFPDGTTPPKQVLLKFLQIAEKTPGAIAVHCKAGLGRTGSLIGAYIIKHYQFTAKEAIAWMRICRPGSVIGQQQGWLEKIEPWLWKQGTIFRVEHYGEDDKLPQHKYGIYSKVWQLQRKKMLLLAHKRTQSEGPKTTIKTSVPFDYDIYRVKQRERELHSLYRKIKERELAPNSLEERPPEPDNRKYYNKARIPPEERTQGDRLNEIKMRKYLSTTEKYNKMSSQNVVEARNRLKYNKEKLMDVEYIDIPDKHSKLKEKQYYM